MPCSAQDVAQVQHVVQANLRVILGFELPAALFLLCAATVAILDTHDQQAISPVWGLVALVGALTVVIAAANRGRQSPLSDKYGAYSLAFLTLGYFFVTMHVFGYNTPVHNAGVLRLGSLYLTTACAHNHYEALAFAAIHFGILAASTNLGEAPVDLLLLLVTDVFYVFIAWVKGALIATSEQVLRHSSLLAQDADQRREVHTRMFKVSKATVQNTLLGLCSTVVPLGADLELSEPCQQLAAMLGRSSKHMTTGRPFTDFLCADDVATFKEHMRQTSERVSNATEEGVAAQLPALTGSLKVRLVDAFGQLVPVQLFCIAFRDDLVEPVSFLAGICEAWEPTASISNRGPRSHTKTADATGGAYAVIGSLASRSGVKLGVGTDALFGAINEACQRRSSCRAPDLIGALYGGPGGRADRSAGRVPFPWAPDSRARPDSRVRKMAMRGESQ